MVADKDQQEMQTQTENLTRADPSLMWPDILSDVLSTPVTEQAHFQARLLQVYLSIFKSTSHGYQHSCKRPKSFISIRISTDISSFDLIFHISQWDHYYPIPLCLQKFL